MSPDRSSAIVLAALGLGLAAASPAAAAPPAVHALTGVKVVVAPGQVIDSATIVLRDGVIEAVGPEVEPPADATVWERDGATVYAGLIEPYAVQSRPYADDTGADATGAAPQAAHPNPLVRPGHDVTPYARQEDSLRRLREAGFTTAMVAPRDGLFRGRGALVNLGEGDAASALLGRGGSQFADITASGEQGYPSSRMGLVALFRQTLLDAAWQRQAEAAYRRRPAQPRPPYDTSLAVLAAAAAGEERLVIETGSAVGSLRAIALVDELALDAWLVGNGEEYRWLEPIAAAGLPHLLPLTLPDDPAVGDEDDMTVGLDELRHWDEAPANPARLLAAGLTVAFTSHGLAEPKQLHANVERMIDRGLTAEQALAAMTTVPAELLGITRVAGTVEAGKMANLVVVDGELFTAETKVRELWIDGRRHEIKETKPPEVEPAGSWELTVETPDGGKIPVTMELTGEAPSLAGTLTVRGESIPLATAEVSGSQVEISFDSTAIGMPGTIELTLEIDGEQASGSGISPGGPFTISGRRIAGPGGGR